MQSLGSPPVDTCNAPSALGIRCENGRAPGCGCDPVFVGKRNERATTPGLMAPTGHLYWRGSRNSWLRTTRSGSIDIRSPLKGSLAAE